MVELIYNDSLPVISRQGKNEESRRNPPEQVVRKGGPSPRETRGGRKTGLAKAAWPRN